MVFIIVFRPGPVASPGFKFWLGWSGQFFFFLNQNDIVLVKKSQQIATGSCRVNPPGQLGHNGFFLTLFFLQPDPVPALVRPGFKTMIFMQLSFSYY
jgi:CubicO group peptidase (beta-lactamase class C family)